MDIKMGENQFRVKAAKFGLNVWILDERDSTYHLIANLAMDKNSSEEEITQQLTYYQN